MKMLDKLLRRESDLDSGLDFPDLDKDPMGSQHQSFDKPKFDYTNPDMNEQLGVPKPRDIGEVQRPVAPPEPPPSQSAPGLEKDIQIVIAKLDAIKAELDSLHQRVQKIERIADADAVDAQKAYGRW